MRVGHNPNREAKANRLTPIVLASVVHIPELGGYHQYREKVVQTSLESMVKHAGGEYSTIIFADSVCLEVMKWIKREIKPTVLIETKGIGKAQAQRMMLSMVKPDTIFCYSDDDMYFYPNWLNPQLEILNTFPDVSVVSGYPVRTSFRWGNEHTIERMRHKGRISFERSIPQQWEDDFAVSIGRDVQFHRQTSLNDLDTVCDYGGKKVYLTSHHCQFIGYAKNILEAKQDDGMAMGDERGFDIQLDIIGNRFCTTQRLSRHMGNVIDEKLQKDITETW